MKRLLISIPTKANGAYSPELSWWLTGIQFQTGIMEFAEAMVENMSDLASRLQVRRLAEKFAVGWGLEQTALQWLDAEGDKAKDLGKIMVPPGWSIAMAPCFGHPIDANRNEQVRRFLFHLDHGNDRLVETDFDAVLFIDSDNVPGRHDLHLLCEAIERTDVDVVGGVYCMEAPEGPKPLVYTLSADGKGFEYDAEIMTRPIGLHKLERGGLPGGLLMVKRHVFEKMWESRRIWFKDRLRDCSFDYHEIHALLGKFKDDPAGLYGALKEQANEKGIDWALPNVGSWHIGEDIWFCRMCHDLGIDIWVDTRLFVKHLKTADNKQTFLRQQAIARRFWKHGAGYALGESAGADLDDAYRRWCTDRATKAMEEPVGAAQA